MSNFNKILCVLFDQYSEKNLKHIFMFTTCISLYKILFKTVDCKKVSTTYNQIEEVFINESKNNTKENIFPKMKELNVDYSFWINAENLTVNYLVVKENNNFDYLKENFLKKIHPLVVSS